MTVNTAAAGGSWRRLKPVLLLLVFCTLVTGLHFLTLRKTFHDWTWSVPVDDTYIHLQYARGIANGHPFQYHWGDGYSTGCTSPLYVALLSVFFVAGMDGLELVPATIALGGVWLFLSMLLLLRLGKQLHNATAGRVAAALWGTWGFTWYCMHCGMETGLWVVMILALLSGFISWTRQGNLVPRWHLLLLASLVPLTRPEGIVLLGVLGLVALHRIAVKRPWRAWPVPMGAWSLALLPAAAYYLTNRLLTGTFSTAGMTSKSLLHAPYMWPTQRLGRYAEQLFESAQHFLVGEDPLFLSLAITLPGLAALGAMAMRERERKISGPFLVLGLWTLLLLLFASGHYIRIARWERYYLPFFLFITLGAGFALTWIARAFRRPWFAPAAALVLVFYQGDSTVRWVKQYAADLTTIHDKQASAALAAKAMPKGTRLLVCDAGAIPYLSGKWTFDLVGLTSPVSYNYFRNGVGSRFELFERLPKAKRPTHIAAYGFCLWHGAEGTTLSMHRDMMIAELAEKDAETGHVPLTQYAGWKVADRVDIADLHSEAEHGYTQSFRGSITDNIVHRDRPPGEVELPVVADGGRLVTQRHDMTFKAKAGKALKVVARFTVGLNVRLRLDVNGQAFPVKLDATAIQQWREITVEVPASRVKADNTFSVRTTNGAAFHAYHYFFMQKGKRAATRTAPAKAVKTKDAGEGQVPATENQLEGQVPATENQLEGQVPALVPALKELPVGEGLVPARVDQLEGLAPSRE
jgi:hypothetical protein